MNQNRHGDKWHRVRRYVLIAFVAHAAFLVAVLIVEHVSSTITLRRMHEQIVDRHAYQAWWWLQGRFPHQIGTLLFPAAQLLGLEHTSMVVWGVWYLVMGPIPYMLLAGVAAALKTLREKPSTGDIQLFGTGGVATMTENAQLQPNSLSVEFAVFRLDDLLCRGTICIEEREASDEFDYVDSAVNGAAGWKAGGRLVLRHRFSLPTPTLHLMLIHATERQATPRVVLEAGLAIGVHTSTEWESVALGHEYTFAFLCREEPRSN